MKAFIAAASILAVTVVMMILNTVFINNLSADLCDILDRIPEDAGEAESNKDEVMSNADKVSELWHGKRTLLGITVASDEILEIDRQMTEMKTFLQNDEFEEAITSKERLAEQIDLLKRREEISLDNIL